MQKSQNSYIRVKIKTIDSNIHDIVFDENNPSIKDLKKKIELKLKIPPKKQRLIYQGRVLQENLYFSDYKIENDYVIHLVEQQENAVNNQGEHSNNGSNTNYLGRENIQNSPFGDIFNMILQSSREINNNILNQSSANSSNTNNFNNNLRSSGFGFSNPQNNSNNNLINFPELGLGGLNSNLFNFSNLPRTGEINSNNSTNSLFNNFNNLNNFNISEYEGLFIPESFKSLEKRTSFNKVETIEVLKQNINNIKELIKNTANLNYEYFHTIKNIFVTNETSMNPTIDFKIGQWIDAKDSLDIWVEAQIVDIKDNKAFVHFFGWGNSFNEWINIDSNRLALFRTYTLQSPFTKYYSSFPNKKEEGGLILTNLKDFDNFENLHDLVNFIDKLREKIMKVIFEREAYNIQQVRYSRSDFCSNLYNDCNNINRNNNYNNAKNSIEEEKIKFEKTNFFSICQLVPLMDRIGRLCSDFSNYMFNYCFNKFEDDYEKYRSNIGNDGNSYNLNLHSTNTPERILNKKLHAFYNITQIPNMRNPGEVAEAQNLNRPRVGVFIGLNSNNSDGIANGISQTNNNTNRRNPSKFENNKLLITKQPNLEINSKPKTIIKKFYLDSYAQTLESSKNFKKCEIKVNKSDEFSFLNSTKIKQVEKIKKKEEEEKKSEIKSGIHKFYATGSKNNKAEKNEKTKEEEENKQKDFSINNKNDNITYDLGTTKTKFSLLKKLSEKNLINIKADSTNELKESKTLFRETKSISKPFSNNQLKLNNDTNRTPIIVKENVKYNLNINSKPLNVNSNKSIEKSSVINKDSNKFRRVTKK